MFLEAAMPVDRLRRNIADALRAWSFEVVEIEETDDSKTPDLLVSRGSEEYLIEIKSKRDDRRRVAEERQTLRAGGLVERSDQLGVRNTTAGVIREAVDQLEAFEPGTERIRLVWFQTVGEDAEVQERQFRATIFGTTNVVDLDNDGPMLPCYFFRESAFFRHSASLDGAVVACGDQAQLLMNTYSPRVERLRRSALARRFRAAVHDPEQRLKSYESQANVGGSFHTNLGVPAIPLYQHKPFETCGPLPWDNKKAVEHISTTLLGLSSTVIPRFNNKFCELVKKLKY